MNKLKKLFKILFFREIYALAIRNGEGEKFKIIYPTDAEWYADPFLFEYKNEVWLFSEVMNYENGRGHIGVMKLGEQNTFKTALAEPFHLSFPNVFAHDGNIYMLPETCFSNSLRLYRCIDFPCKWTLESVLLDDVRFVDTAVFDNDGQLYLETFDKDSGGNRLFEFNIAEKRLLEIDSSAGNFVNRRPGGNFICGADGVYHALQNCDREYGEYLHIAKVERFDSDGLFENEITQVKVENLRLENHNLKFKRIHTFNSCKGYDVIDLLYTKLDLKNLPLKFIKCVSHKLHVR